MLYGQLFQGQLLGPNVGKRGTTRGDQASDDASRRCGTLEAWELVLCVENLFEMCSTAEHNQRYYMEDYVISNRLSLLL